VVLLLTTLPMIRFKRHKTVNKQTIHVFNVNGAEVEFNVSENVYWCHACRTDNCRHIEALSSHDYD